MIQLHNINVVFPGGAVGLHPTTLHFTRGEFTVLLGSSGAGKSTLLRCLNLLTRPTGGTVTAGGLGELCDRKILHRHRQRTAMIFQQHQLIERHTALQNVLLGRLGYHSTWRSLFPLPRRERFVALECLERVGLLHKALERVDRLSGGQQQRVGIARALAQQPQLMLADEPVASLDPATADKVLALLHSICKEDGISTVVSLHQVELAQTYADRIVGLAHGRVVYDGSPAALTQADRQEIYHQPGQQPPAPARVPPSPVSSLTLATIED